MIPKNQRFIRELAYRLCMQAGDSWSCDSGAQCQWMATALQFATEGNKVIGWQRQADRRRQVKAVPKRSG